MKIFHHNHLAYIVTICTFSCFYTLFIFVHHLARPYTHFINNISLQGPGLESLSPSSQITTKMSDPLPVIAICADYGSCLETRRKRRQNFAVLQKTNIPTHEAQYVPSGSMTRSTENSPMILQSFTSNIKCSMLERDVW